MDSSKIKAISVAVLATFVALYLGINAATAQGETLAWVLASAAVITCISLGRKVWLLIPFMTALSIQLSIPGRPDTGLLGQVLALGFCLPLFLMRKLPFRLAWTELEFWMLLLTAFVVQVYMRNPVGLNLFGGASVGAKPYFMYAICLASGLLLSGLRVPASDLKWVLRLSIFGGLLNLAVSILGSLVTGIGYYIVGSMVQSDEPNYENYGQAVDTGRANRVGFLAGFGANLSLWIAAYISPLRACLRPLWLALVLLAIAAAALSGFRNTIATVGLTFMVGIAYRHGISGLFVAGSGALAGIAMLAIVNSLHPLPPNIQRSLSFLPGTWDERHVLDAQDSSDWRFDIWREVLLTDRWIENKWLGDGLGFKASELASQYTIHKGARLGISGFDAHRESILTSGDYHSGPVQTIRTIGYIGLIVLLLAQIRLAVHAHRQIQRCRGTEWLPLALFIGITLIWAPIFFVFIVGSFTQATASLLLGYGMVRMMENNLPLPIYVTRGHVPMSSVYTSGLRGKNIR